MFEITTKWHKVSEELPKDRQIILVYVNVFGCDIIKLFDYFEEYGMNEFAEYWADFDEVVTAIEKSAEADEAATTDSENQLSTV